MDNLRISTITGTAILDTNINLKELYDLIQINDLIHYIEYGCDNFKGSSIKQKKKKRKDAPRKVFYNQITIHVHFNNKLNNVKVFNNGHIQMTGLKDISHVEKVLQAIIDDIYELLPEENTIFDKPDKPLIISTKIALINSDFDIHFEVNREILHREILKAGIYSTYEPCIYPGVNIKYFYNPSKNKIHGICSCEGYCDGKGNNDDCKKITIAVFKSGKVIITGGNSLEQLTTSYQFIYNFLTDKKDLIKI